MSQSVLDWVEDTLRAERHSLHVRHELMMKTLALELEGAKWKNGVPPISALDQLGPARNKNTLEVNMSPLLPKHSQDHRGLAEPACQRSLPDGLQPPQAIGDLEWDADQIVANKNDVTHVESGQEHVADSRREWVRRLLNNQIFETFIGGVIVVNSIVMGLETQFEIEGKDVSIFHALENFFLACYTLELCMWFYGHGFSIICRNGWVAFDFVLVVFGILGTYVIGPLVENLKDSNDETLKNTLAGLLVMRMMRLFRLARILRVLVVFKVLWMLIRGLLGSAGTIAYTMGLIIVIVYMFACMSMELITKKQRDSADDAIRALVAEHFTDLPITMLSLLQFVSLDGTSILYFPLVKADPVLIFFFLPLIFIVSVSLMNLVTAVIVEGAIEQGKQDREATNRYRQHAFKKLTPKLRQMFKEIDLDGNKVLTREELVCAPDHIKQELGGYMQSGSDALLELFEMLDVDESGEVDLDEFCDGVAKLVYSEAPVELVRVLKQLKIIRKHVEAQHPRCRSVAGIWVSEESIG